MKEKLNTAIDANIKLNGGVLKLDSDSEILSLQQQIQDITNQVSTAQEDAKFDTLKIKYGGAALDAESFASLQEELKNTVSSMTSQYDEALEVNVTNLRLQLDRGDIDQDEYDRQLQALTDSYHAQVSDLKVRVESFQLDSIAEAYSSALDGILPDLKGTTSEKLQQAMDAALKEKPNVADWTNSDVVEWFDLNGMDAETQAALVERLKAVADSMPASFADSIRGSGLGEAARDAVDDELDAVSATKFKKDVYAQFNLHSSMNSVVSPSSSGSSSYTSPVTRNYMGSYYDGHTSRHNEFSSDTVDYLSQTVNEAPVASNLFSEDDSTASTSSSSQNVASTSQTVTVRPEVTVKVDVNPEFNITGGEKSEDEIMAVIRRHMKEMADEIGGELATKLDEVFSNMPLKGVSA